MQDQGGTGRRVSSEGFAGRHRGGSALRTGEHNALGNLGHRQLGADKCCSSRVGGYARCDIPRDAGTVESTGLLVQGRVQRWITRAQARDVLAGPVRLHQVCGDLVECQVPAVNQRGAVRAMRENLCGDIGSGINTDR